MGMFDTVRCEYPLPELNDPTRFEFQTKDLDCSLDNYVITKEGRLVLKFKLYDKEGTNRDIDVGYDGVLNFYGNKYSGEIHAFNPRTGQDLLHPGPEPEWFEYEATFEEGQLTRVSRIKAQRWGAEVYTTD